MTNPNTVTVYSPDGEPFEMSRVNARDLCAHRQWSMSPPDPAAANSAKPKEPAVAAPAVERGIEDEAEQAEAGQEEAGHADEAEAGYADEAEDGEEVAPTVFTTAEQFAHLETREEVVAYLAATFPEFRPHHKSSRDGLVAKAIELAAG